MEQREIKFRGKRVDNGEWVFGYYVFSPTNAQHRIYYKPFEEASSNTYHIVSPESVGQYVLTNRYNQDVFEDDLVEKTEGGITYKSKVVFGKRTLGFGLHINYLFYTYRKIDGSEIKIYKDKFYRLNKGDKVIGNIYENPELLTANP